MTTSSTPARMPAERGAQPGATSAAEPPGGRGGPWRWLGRRGSFARRLLLSYGLVVVVDVAVFIFTGLYMSPSRLNGTPRDRSYQDAVFTNQLEAVVIAALISLVVGAAAAVLIPRLLLDPLRQLRRSTRSFMEGHYAESVPEPRVPELTELVRDVNVLGARLADLELRRARLVSDVAHELRTPLTIIDGQLSGVEDGLYRLDSALIASVREELDRLRRLTDDLSGLSRAEENAYDLHPTDVDIAELTADLTDRLRHQFVHAGIELRHTTAGPAPAEADPHRITQILTNLLRNALAATPVGGTVMVTTTHAQQAVTVEVADTGRGIAAADLGRIFERFERVTSGDAAQPAEHTGSGIGLTIARSLARAHGGELSAASPGLGLGARMTLTLPARAVRDGERAARPAVSAR